MPIFISSKEFVENKSLKHFHKFITKKENPVFEGKARSAKAEFIENVSNDYQTYDKLAFTTDWKPSFKVIEENFEKKSTS